MSSPFNLPRSVVVVAAVGAALVLLPLFSLALQVDWLRFPALIGSEASLAALRLSLQTSTASTGLCILLGVPMAVVLAQGRFSGLRILRALVLLPLALPQVVGGHRPAANVRAARAPGIHH